MFRTQLPLFMCAMLLISGSAVADRDRTAWDRLPTPTYRSDHPVLWSKRGSALVVHTTQTLEPVPIMDAHRRKDDNAVRSVVHWKRILPGDLSDGVIVQGVLDDRTLLLLVGAPPLQRLMICHADGAYTEIDQRVQSAFLGPRDGVVFYTAPSADGQNWLLRSFDRASGEYGQIPHPGAFRIWVVDSTCRLVCFDRDGTLTLRDGTSGKPLASWNVHEQVEGECLDLQPSADGRRCLVLSTVTATNGELQPICSQLDLLTGQVQQADTLGPATPGQRLQFAAHADAMRYVVAEPATGRIRFYRSGLATPIHELLTYQAVRVLGWSDVEKLISVDVGGVIRIFEHEPDDRIKEYPSVGTYASGAPATIDSEGIALLRNAPGRFTGWISTFAGTTRPLQDRRPLRFASAAGPCGVLVTSATETQGTSTVELISAKGKVLAAWPDLLTSNAVAIAVAWYATDTLILAASESQESVYVLHTATSKTSAAAVVGPFSLTDLRHAQITAAGGFGIVAIADRWLVLDLRNGARVPMPDDVATAISERGGELIGTSAGEIVFTADGETIEAIHLRTGVRRRLVSLTGHRIGRLETDRTGRQVLALNQEQDRLWRISAMTGSIADVVSFEAGGGSEGPVSIAWEATSNIYAIRVGPDNIVLVQRSASSVRPFDIPCTDAHAEPLRLIMDRSRYAYHPRGVGRVQVFDRAGGLYLSQRCSTASSKAADLTGLPAGWWVVVEYDAWSNVVHREIVILQ